MLQPRCCRCLSEAGKMSVPAFGTEMRQQQFSILLPEVAYINQASYGNKPRQVFDQELVLYNQFESDPDSFMRRDRRPLWDASQQAAATFVGTSTSNIAMVENTTKGINCILKTLTFQSGDAILRNNYTYGAVTYTIDDVISRNPGVSEVVIQHQYPIVSTDQIIQEYTTALDTNPNIKLAVIDHVSSVPSIRFPLEQLIPLCKSRGVMVLVDGAHGTGQFNLNLDTLGADFYVSSMHKWCFAPRGCSIIYVAPEHHDVIMSVITSWGYPNPYPDPFFNQGTRDVVLETCGEMAINFLNWAGGVNVISSYCVDLADRNITMLIAALGTGKYEIPLAMEAPFIRNILVPDLPNYPKTDTGKNDLQSDLRDIYNIWVATFLDGGEIWMRISFSIYCVDADYERLRDAVLELRDGIVPKRIGPVCQYDATDLQLVHPIKKGSKSKQKRMTKNNSKSSTCKIM